MDDNKGRSRKRKTFVEQLTFSKGVKKTLALLLATVMMLTSVDLGNVTAWAANTHTSAEQIVENKEMATKGNINDGLVQVKKTVAGTNVENQFNITLDVTTTEKLGEIAVDENAAVVLVMDRSGSMDWNVDGKSPKWGEDTRLAIAQKAAKNFIEGFKSSNPESKRLVALVGFASTAKTLKPTGDYWTDLSGKTYVGDWWTEYKDNDKIVCDAIDGLEAEGGTNIEAGLQLAYNLINKRKDNELKGITNINIVLLTDGCPTYRIDDDWGTETKESKLNSIDSYDGRGGSTSKKDYERVEALSDKIRTKGINGLPVSFYSIAFASSKDSSKVHEKSLYDWLNSISTAFSSDKADDLTIAFTKITQLIALGAQAWIVTDPMAQYVDYTGPDSHPDPVAGDNNAYSFNNDNKTLTWNLKKSEPSTKTEGKVTYYSYSLTYPITLDTTPTGFPFGEALEANDITTLYYFMFSKVDDKTVIPDKPDSLNFNVPTVKGYKGTLAFNKVMAGTKTALKDATFTLSGTSTGSNKPVTLTANSDASGKVLFDNIPAGKYKLTETAAPNGFQASSIEKDVTVSYGEVTPNSIINSDIENEVKKTTVEGTKVWSGDSGNTALRDEKDITLDLYIVHSDGSETKTDYKAVWTKTDGDVWSYQFKDVAEYDANGNKINYTVKETVNNGAPYTPTYENGNKIVNTITEGKLFVKKSLDENQPAISGDKFTLTVSGKFSDTAAGKKDFVFAAEPSATEYKIGEAISVPGAIAGFDYSVSETSYNKDRYEMTVVTGNAKAATTETANTPVLEVKNTLKTGKLSVKKDMAAGSELQDEDRFTLRVSGKFNDKATFKDFVFASTAGDNVYKVGEAIEVPNTIVGETYTVTELSGNTGDRYTATITSDNKVSVKEGAAPAEVLVVTNAARKATFTINGKKVWENIPDGATVPASIKINLYRSDNAETVFATTTIENGGQEYTFADLQKYAPDGTEYQYIVKEETPNGYEVSVDGYTITNKYASEQIVISGSKEWNRQNVSEDVPYPTVKLNLYQNDSKEPIATTLIENGGTSYSFDPVPKYAPDGSEYKYRVEEEKVPGYTSSWDASKRNVTNTYEAGKKDINGAKTWVGLKEGDAYPEIEIELLQDNKPFGTTTLKDGATTYQFKDVPVYSPEGKEYSYTVKENLPNGYKNKIDGFAITNSYEPETTFISGKKTWIGVEGTKHSDAVIELYQDDTRIDTKTLTGGNNNYRFENLPVYATDGHKYNYSVKEQAIPGYESAQDGNNFTNTYTGGENIVIKGTKTWNGLSDEDQYPTIKLSLIRNGDKQNPVQTIELSEGATSYEFAPVEPYDIYGKAYNYTVEEDVPKGYTLTRDEKNPYNLINTFNAGSVEISGVKTWSNENASHPVVTVQLYRSEKGSAPGTGDAEKPIQTTTVDPTTNTYSFKELPKYSTTGNEYSYQAVEVVPDGYSSRATQTEKGTDFYNEYDPSSTSVSVTKQWAGMPENAVYPDVTFRVYKENDLSNEVTSITLKGGNTAPASYTFENLEKFAPDGSVYKYVVKEDAIPGYVQKELGNNVFLNTYDNSQVTSVSGDKTWVGGGQDTTRPAITIDLYRDDQVVAFRTLTSGTTHYSFDNLPIYATDGHTYAYRVAERKVLGYDSEQNGNNFTNTYNPGSVNVTVTKQWDNIQNSIYPDVTINLYQNGKADVFDTVILKDGESSHTFENLPLFAPDGSKYTYTAEEVDIDGYRTEKISDYGFKNTYTPGSTDIQGRKTWSNPNDEHPAVTIILKQNGVEYDSRTLENGVSEYIFTGLPVYAPDGSRYTYEIAEAKVEGYEPTITGYDVYNQYTPGKISFEGAKVWEGVPDGAKYPDVTINLYRDGEWYRKIVLVNGARRYFLTDLEEYAPNGEKYNYTVSEDEIPGYTSSLGSDKKTFTNTYNAGTTDIAGVKNWAGTSDKEAYPIATVNLLQNGIKFASTTIENGQTTYEFKGVPKFAPDGTEYKYTVEEEKIPGYDTAIDGYEITNTYTGGETLDIAGTKTWEGVPDSTVLPTVTIRLLQNGKEIDKRELTSGATEYSFTGLKKFAQNGEAYTYELSEDPIPGYNSAASGYNFKNTYSTSNILIRGEKTWIGGEGSVRPNAEIQLFRSDDTTTPFRTVTLTNGNTTYSFEVPEFAPTGEAYKYTIKEAPVNGYTSEVEGYNVTNTYTGGETVEVSGAKTWSDVPAGTTHPDATIVLTQNGQDFQTVKITEGNYSFTGLPKYSADGNTYEYAVYEISIPGYDTILAGNDFTNKYTGGKPVSVTGSKEWKGLPENAEHPEVVIELYQNDGSTAFATYTIPAGTDTKQSYEFNDLPQFAPDGSLYKYTVKEITLSGYQSQKDGWNFTNTYTPGTTEVNGTKTWDVPEGTTEFPDVVIELYRNDDTENYYDTTTITGGAESYEFANLPKFAPDGTEYQYTVKEIVPDGYDDSKSEGYKLTNTYTGGEEVIVSGEKRWEGVAADTVKPVVTIELYQDSKKISETTVDPVTNKYEFTGLPGFATDGHAYAYTVREKDLAGYSSEKEGDYNFVNTYAPDETSLSITKIWENMPNEMNGKKYPEITFNLFQIHGDDRTQVDQVKLSNGEAGYTFNNLDKFAPDGSEYRYEAEEAPVSGYESSSAGNIFTNKYVPGTKDIEVTKNWVGVPEGTAYPTATIKLYQKDSAGEIEFATAYLRDGASSYTFANLPVYATDGTEFIYRAEEVNIPNGYEMSRDESSPFTFTNTYTGGEKVSVSGTKTWADNSNAANLRPGSVTLALYEVTESGRKPVSSIPSWTNTDTDVWTYTFSNLPKYNAAGSEIVYHVEEEAVPYYTTSYSETNQKDITNTLTSGSLKVTKLLGNSTQIKDDDRFTLTVNGIFSDTGSGSKSYTFGKSSESGIYTIGEEVAVTGVVEGQTYSVSEATNTGERYTQELTVREATAAASDAVNVPVLTVTNSSRNAVKTIEGTKTWIDVPANVEKPEVTIVLFQNDSEFDTTTIKNGESRYEFKDLPVYDESGEPYSYTVEELPVEGYTSDQVNDTDFTNTFQKTSITLMGKKHLDGNLELTENQFAFELYEGSKLLATAWNDSDGNIDFGTIGYDVRDKGLHTYTIKEVNDDVEGITYDSMNHKVEVNVESVDGVFKANIISIDGDTYEEGDVVEFYNSYETPVNNLVIEKHAVGSSDETFEFEVTVNGEMFIGNYTMNNDDEIFQTDDGKIYLKAGEKAILQDIERGASYEVRESDSKGHAVLANGEATDTAAGTMISKREGTPSVEFVNIPKDKLVIAKTRIGGRETDTFKFSVRYSKANASDATPGDGTPGDGDYDTGTPSGSKSKNGRRENFKTLLEDLFDSDGNPIYAFTGAYNLYAKDSDGKLVNKGSKSADKGEIVLHGGELAVINGFVVDSNYEITEILDDDADYRLAEASAVNPYRGTIATGSNAEAMSVEEDFVNLANFINVFKYSEIKTRYTLRKVDAEGNTKDKVEGSIPKSSYAKFDVSEDLSKLETDYFNDLYKADDKENTYDLVSVEVIKVTANNQETILYNDTAKTVDTALSDFDIKNLDEDAVYRITVDFIRVKGSVVLTKTGPDGQPLAGAKFQLYNSNNDKVGNVMTTDANGQIIKEDLLPGSYYFVETEAPAGYVTDTTPQEFELESSNGYMKVVNLTMENAMGTGSATLKKVDVNGKGLEGVSFNLYDISGEQINTEALVTNANGEITVDNLDAGSYYFVEQDALPGYVADTSEIHFEITFADIASKKPVSIKPFVNNYEENGVIILTKTDRSQRPLAGANFDLYKEGMENPIRTNLTTGTDGTITVEGLSVGNYYFVETKAPAGYVTPAGDAAKSATVTVEFVSNIRDGKAATVTVENDIQTGSVTLTKTNADGTTALAGARFSLYDADGVLVRADLVTNTNGIITVDNLPVGNYYFVETEAPDGYKLPTGTDARTDFAVTYGTTTTLTVENTLSSNGNNNNNGGGSDGGSHTRGDTTGGPGATIPDNPVPLAGLPGSDNGIVINDGLVPLAALPKTGDSPFKGLMALFSGLMLGLAALLGKKKKEDEQ